MVLVNIQQKSAIINCIIRRKGYTLVDTILIRVYFYFSIGNVSSNVSGTDFKKTFLGD